MRRPLTKIVLTAAVLAAAFSAQVASASAADVNVVGPRGGATQTIALESLAPQFDVDADYSIVDAAGQTRSQHVRGISVARLLDLVDADSVYSALEVVRADGTTVVIAKSQILAAGVKPVVYLDGGALTFLRPSYRPGDANAADIVSVPGALTLRQTDMQPLSIAVKASKTKAKARELVRFTATASGAGAGQDYEFTWRFNDGAEADGPAVSHRFSKRGTYRVLVAVRPEGADRSDSKIVEVTVGDPVRSKKQRSGNGTNDAAGAPVSGSADGDSGNGEQAATRRTSKQAGRKPRSEDQQTEPQLPVVRGELLAATTDRPPVTASSTLAARSGQIVTENSQGFGLSKEAWGAIGAFALVAFGFAFECGGFGAARRRIRGIA